MDTDVSAGPSSIEQSSWLNDLEPLYIDTMFLPSMHHLSERLVNAAADIPAPIPASQRIPERPFMSTLQGSWNSQIEALFRGTQELDQQVVSWARRTLYGGDASRTKPE